MRPMKNRQRAFFTGAANALYLAGRTGLAVLPRKTVLCGYSLRSLSLLRFKPSASRTMPHSTSSSIAPVSRYRTNSSLLDEGNWGWRIEMKDDDGVDMHDGLLRNKIDRSQVEETTIDNKLVSGHPPWRERKTDRDQNKNLATTMEISVKDGVIFEERFAAMSQYKEKQAEARVISEGKRALKALSPEPLDGPAMYRYGRVPTTIKELEDDVADVLVESITRMNRLRLRERHSSGAEPSLLTPSETTRVGRSLRALSYGENPTDAEAVVVCSTSDMQTLEPDGLMTALFNKSPRMSAQHSSSVFIENTASGQSHVSMPNGLDPTSVSQGAESVGGHDSHGKGTENTSSDEQDSPPSKRNTDEDSDQPSDSESEEHLESESEADMEDAEEKHVPLSYQISPEVLHAAMEAPLKTKASYWSQKLYRGPNDEKISTHYCANFEVAEKVAKYFLGEKALGFDVEWKPTAFPYSIKQNASLIQIASEDRIALFHVALFQGSTPEQLVPPTLKTILESPDILKVGVAVKADFTRLRKHLGIEARGVMELSRTHNLLEAFDPKQASFKLVGLATQVKQHLRLPLYKGEPLADDPEPNEELEWQKWRGRQRVRESDWSKKLDKDQIHYAAADAYAGLRLYDVLESKRKQLKPIPPLPRLCDADPQMAPRMLISKKKANVAKILKHEQAKVIAEALTGLPAEDPDEEDTQEYETAHEELESEKAEGERSESVSDTSSEDADQLAEDPDEDYVPKWRGRGNISRVGEDPESVLKAPSRRVGRLDFSRLRGPDPGYPTLPTCSSDEDASEESDTFEPLPRIRLRQLVAIAASPHPVSLEVRHDGENDGDSEDTDAQLNETFTGTSITEFEKTKTGTRTSADAMQVEERETTVDATTSNDVQNTEGIDIDAPEPSQPMAPTPTLTPLFADTSAHPPQYILATTWAQAYLDSTIPSASPSSDQPSRIRATVPHLRAYHIWHHQGVALEDIGSLLREYPLAQNTVAIYICQAVQLEGLDFEVAKLRALLEGMPEGPRKGRWKWLSRKVAL